MFSALVLSQKCARALPEPLIQARTFTELGFRLVAVWIFLFLLDLYVVSALKFL